MSWHPGDRSGGKVTGEGGKMWIGGQMYQSAITKDSPRLLPKDAIEVFQNETADA